MKRVRRICKEHGYARHRSKKRLEAQRLCRETTLTYKEIREKIGVHKGNVSKWCKGIKRPGKILSPLQKKRALQKKKAIDLCIKTDMSAEDIAKEVGVVAGTIYGWCKGLVTIRQKYLDPEMIPDLKRRARKLCRSKSWTLKEIAEYLGVEKSSNISSWCKGIIRPSGESRRKSRLKREVRSLYQKYLAAGKPFIFIKMAKHFGVGRITLSRWTKDLVPTARDPETIETEVLRAFEERGRILPAAEAANTTWRTAREILIKHGKNIKKNKCSNCGDRRHYRNSCPYRRHNPRRRTPDIGLDFLYRII
jgi:transcriptional regulator with XRE-family HTH domain